MLHAQDHLNQAGHPSSGFQMTDVRFDRTKDAAASVRPRLPDDFAQGFHLDGVADLRAGAVRLDIGEL